MKNKIILVDVDGVMLDWSTAFNNWMLDNGYTIHPTNDPYDLAQIYGIPEDERMNRVREFNNSDAIANLSPHKDAVEYVKLIHDEHNYKFLVISSMSKHAQAREIRITGLERTFGDVFSDYIFLDTAADKSEVLKQFEGTGCFWLEDKVENAQAGLNVGLRSLIMEHDFNKESNIAPIIKDWKQFYKEYIV